MSVFLLLGLSSLLYFQKPEIILCILNSRFPSCLEILQLFRQRLSHKSVKAYATRPIGTISRERFGVDWLRFTVFTNKERQGINTFVCSVSHYVAETSKASIKAHEPITHNTFRYCRVRFCWTTFLETAVYHRGLVHNHSYENFNLHVNEISVSNERMGTSLTFRTSFSSWFVSFQYAPCTIRSHGTKSHMLGRKLTSGTSKTEGLVPVHLDLPLFWKSHRPTCMPACVILFHVIGSCKGPFKTASESKLDMSWTVR